MKKAGIPLVRSFLHSVEEIVPYYSYLYIEDYPEILLAEQILHSRLNITVMVRFIKLIVIINLFVAVENIVQAFPAKGDGV